MTFQERDDGLFDITERLGSRGQSRTLRSGVTIRTGLARMASEHEADCEA